MVQGEPTSVNDTCFGENSDSKREKMLHTQENLWIFYYLIKLLLKCCYIHTWLRPTLLFVTCLKKSYEMNNLQLLNVFCDPQVLTKDSVTVSVDAVVYYRVSNAIVSIANVANAHQSTRLLAQTTLRNILGTKNLHEILSDREGISNSMQVWKLTLLFLVDCYPRSCSVSITSA